MSRDVFDGRGQCNPTAEEVLVDVIKIIQPLSPQDRWKVMETARVWFGKEVTR